MSNFLKRDLSKKQLTTFMDVLAPLSCVRLLTLVIFLLCSFWLIIISFSMSFLGICQTSLAQEQPILKSLTPQFISEANCPVEAISTKADFEVDGFGVPYAARFYIDYKNVGVKPIVAVKFRIGYVDNQGKIKGLFHAPDNKQLEPGFQASQKWRGQKVDPQTQSIKIRVLLVKFADGTTWESEKMKEITSESAQQAEKSPATLD